MALLQEVFPVGEAEKMKKKLVRIRLKTLNWRKTDFKIQPQRVKQCAYCHSPVYSAKAAQEKIDYKTGGLHRLVCPGAHNFRSKYKSNTQGSGIIVQETWLKPYASE